MSTPNPLSSGVRPIQQQAAIALTIAAISLSSKTDQEKLAKALTAQAVANVFQSLAQGDTSALSTALQGLLSGISDPALKAWAESFIAQGSFIAGIPADIMKVVPVASDALQGWFLNTAIGMNYVASAYISAYQQPAAK